MGKSSNRDLLLARGRFGPPTSFFPKNPGLMRRCILVSWAPMTPDAQTKDRHQDMRRHQLNLQAKKTQLGRKLSHGTSGWFVGRHGTKSQTVLSLPAHLIGFRGQWAVMQPPGHVGSLRATACRSLCCCIILGARKRALRMLAHADCFMCKCVARG